LSAFFVLLDFVGMWIRWGVDNQLILR